MDALRVMQAQRYGWERFDALLAETPWLFAGSSTLLAMAVVAAQRTFVARHLQRQPSSSSQGSTSSSPLAGPLSPAGRLLGSVTSEREARALIRDFQPQLLICTDELAEGNGLALVRWLKHARSEVKSVILVHKPNGFKVSAAWASQTDGLIADPLAGEGNLLLALTTVLRGERFFDPKLAVYLNEHGLDWDPQLSSREHQVMTLVA